MSKIFQTQDTALAVTLTTMGVAIPMVNDKYYPLLNIYTPNKLRSLGYNGWKLEDAVRDAHSSGKHGDIFYNFERSDHQAAICKAWSKQSILIANAGEYGPAPTGVSNLDVVEATAFACQLFSNRRNAVAHWKLVTPFITIPGDVSSSDPDADGVRTVVGSFVGYFLDASDAIRQHLKL